MKHGHYSDDELPKGSITDYNVNSYGYRCPEWTPLPEGKKNVVVLGCSHTFGEGLDDGDVWVDRLAAKSDNDRLRWWNLGQPGASADKIVRILYASEKVLFPKIIIVCWPLWSRRERLDIYEQSLTSHDPLLKTETDNTDRNNFLKNVFFAEKFAERQDAKLFHCFAQDVYEINSTYVFNKTTLKHCWPEWDSRLNRDLHTDPNVAKDGLHYGSKHHESFAKKLSNAWGHKLK